MNKWHTIQLRTQLQLGVKSDFVFTRKDYTTFNTPFEITYRLKIYRTGLPKFTPHALRHTHASLLFASGATMKDVQVKLGHEDIQTTMNVYTHMLPQRTKQVNEQFFDYIHKHTKNSGTY